MGKSRGGGSARKSKSASKGKKSNGKKKEPKGKKARARAKLENQWGIRGEDDGNDNFGGGGGGYVEEDDAFVGAQPLDAPEENPSRKKRRVKKPDPSKSQPTPMESLLRDARRRNQDDDPEDGNESFEDNDDMMSDDEREEDEDSNHHSADDNEVEEDLYEGFDDDSEDSNEKENISSNSAKEIGENNSDTSRHILLSSTSDYLDALSSHYAVPPYASVKEAEDACKAQRQQKLVVATTHDPSGIELACRGSLHNQITATESPQSLLVEDHRSGTNKAFDGLQSELMRHMRGYQDVLVTTSPFSEEYNAQYDSFSPETATERDQQNRAHAWMGVAALHIMRHVLACQALCRENNRHLLVNDDKMMDEDDVVPSDVEDLNVSEVSALPSANSQDKDDDRFRDRGFTAPRVLVLLPTRSTCLRFLELLADSVIDNDKNENDDPLEVVFEHAARFRAEYGPVVVSNPKDDDEDEARRRRVLQQKGREWNELFGDDANDDDDFKLGMALVRGRKQRRPKFRLYTDFYSSDIILASPLGLKMMMGGGDDDNDVDTENEEEIYHQAGENSEHGAASCSPKWDFLSSIEICLVGHAEVLLMQNWDHVVEILDKLDRQTAVSSSRRPDVDFSRVRRHHLGGQARFWRQLLILSKFGDPHLASTFGRFGKSVAGESRLRRRTYEGVLGQTFAAAARPTTSTTAPFKQVFRRVRCTDRTTRSTDMAEWFRRHVLPFVQPRTLVFVASYFDFVILRNLLVKAQTDKKQGNGERPISFACVTEYAKDAEVSRNRIRFLYQRGAKKKKGKDKLRSISNGNGCDLLLYTGRAHYFKRHLLKGADHLLCYGLPEYAEFYLDLVTSLFSWERPNDDDDDDNFAEVVTHHNKSCLVLFSRYDAYSLERIVGTQHGRRMIQNNHKLNQHTSDKGSGGGKNSASTFVFS